MCSEVCLAYDLCRQISVRLFRDVGNSVCSALEINALELVDILAALETEVLVSLKFGSFCEDVS